MAVKYILLTDFQNRVLNILVGKRLSTGRETR